MDQATQAIVFGTLISLIWEQSALFNNKETSPLLKILLVTVSGVAWSIVMAALGPAGLPTTLAGAREVLVSGVLIAVGSQLFHQLTNNYFPGLADWLTKLKTGVVVVDGVSTTPEDYLQKLYQDFLKGLSDQHPYEGIDKYINPAKPPEPELEKGG